MLPCICTNLNAKVKKPSVLLTENMLLIDCRELEESASMGLVLKMRVLPVCTIWCLNSNIGLQLK